MMQKLMLALLGVAIAVALLQAVVGADSGLHAHYSCRYGVRYRQMIWAQWVYPDEHNWYSHHHVTYAEQPIMVGVCY
jgi:uncharacterized membrane protein